MPAKKRPVDDSSDTGKMDVYRDLEERVLRDVPQPAPDATLPDNLPGSSVIKAALAERDTGLLRKIAAERKGLRDEQRRALLLIADLLDYAATRATNKDG